MIRFEYPSIGLLLVPWIILFVWNWWQVRKHSKTLDAIGSERVRYYLLGRVRFRRQIIKNALYFVGLCFLLIAATGPQVGTKLVELKRQGVDVMLVLDTSVSMDAQDVKPSRLEKAKYELNRLIDGLQGDRVGIIVFAGTAHLHTPLTSDYSAVKLFLNATDTELIQRQGTVIAEALQLAIDNFDPDIKKYKSVVVISDGEDHDGRALEIAQNARKTGLVIHAIGIGTTTGAPIPIEGGADFKKDKQGRIITSALDEVMLSQLAEAGGGVYTRVDNRSGQLDNILTEILSMEKRTLKTHEFSQFENRFQIFLFLALLCFVSELLLPGGKIQTPRVRRRYA